MHPLLLLPSFLSHLWPHWPPHLPRHTRHSSISGPLHVLFVTDLKISPSSLLDYALISSGLCSNVITLSKVAHSDTPLPRHIPLNNAEVRGTKSSHSRISQYNLKQPCAYVDPHQRLKIHLTLDAHWLISSPQIPLRHNILLLKPLYKQYIRNLLSTVHTHSTLFNHNT